MAHLTRREETVRIPVRAKAALHESGIRLIASNTSCQLSMEASWPPSGHVFPVVGLPSHLSGVRDEITGAFAQPSGLPVFHHLFPPPAPVHNKHTPACHGLKTHTRPILRRIGGLQNDVAAPVKLLLGQRLLIMESLHPIGRPAGLRLAPPVKTEKSALLPDRRSKMLLDMPRILAELIFILPGNVSGSKPVRGTPCSKRKICRIKIRPKRHEPDGRVGI